MNVSRTVVRSRQRTLGGATHVKRRLFVPIVAMLAFGLMAVFASAALAHPSQTSRCQNCHSLSSAVHLTATPVGQTASTTTYAISVNNPYGTNGWGVFAGTAKQFGAAGNGSNVTLTNGTAYTVYGVSGNNNGTEGYATLSITPVAVQDTTAPTTTSNAQATYVSSASIKLTATDNVGGSGVAHTYYILDGGAQTEGTTIGTSVVGAHTIEFWSVDTATNVELPHKTAQFAVTAPLPDTTAPITASDAKTTYVGSATIKLAAVDNVGGSGVAHTYYILDAGVQTEGTSISTSVVGTHTLDFWSVDASGNVEFANTASFAVTAAPPVVIGKAYTYTYKFNLKKRVYRGLKAVLTSRTNGHKYTVTVSKKGVATFRAIPAGEYRLSTIGNSKFKFKARTVRVGTSASHDD